MVNYYILVDRIPVAVDDVLTWGEWMAQDEDVKVAVTGLEDGVRVSTVFLGIDAIHSHDPLSLFESMVFGGRYDQYTVRYTTWDEAREGHDAVIRVVLSGEQEI